MGSSKVFKYFHLMLLAWLILMIIFFGLPITSFAIERNAGEEIFQNHCSGCHIKGGNIIRRGKTLKLSALKRNGLDNPEVIAEIALKGIGNMDGYEKVLKEGEEQIVAQWIWEQAQNAWIQG